MQNCNLFFSPALASNARFFSIKKYKHLKLELYYRIELELELVESDIGSVEFDIAFDSIEFDFS